MVLPVVYQWFTVVKFGVITSGIPVVLPLDSSQRRMILPIPVVYQWKSVVKFGAITMEITGIKYQCFTTEIHCFTGGIKYHQILPLVNPETFSMGL